eukprot:6302157-Alexandrium_andersonii.AAC.1
MAADRGALTLLPCWSECFRRGRADSTTGPPRMEASTVLWRVRAGVDLRPKLLLPWPSRTLVRAVRRRRIRRRRTKRAPAQRD